MRLAIFLLALAKEMLDQVPASTMNVIPYKCRGDNMFLLALIASFRRGHLKPSLIFFLDEQFQAAYQSFCLLGGERKRRYFVRRFNFHI